MTGSSSSRGKLGKSAARTVAELRPDVNRADPDSRHDYAGVVTRTIAIVFDALLIDAVALGATGAALLLKSLLGPAGKQLSINPVVGAILFVVWVIAYFGTFWTITGQTPGNRVMHIRVIRLDGTRMKPRHVLVRLAAMLISVPLFWGYLPILWTPRRRGLPDVMARTVVVEVEDNLPSLLSRYPTRAISGEGNGSRDGGSVPAARVDRDRAVNGRKPVAEVAEPGPARGGLDVEPGPVVADLEAQPPPVLPD